MMSYMKKVFLLGLEFSSRLKLKKKKNPVLAIISTVGLCFRDFAFLYSFLYFCH